MTNRVTLKKVALQVGCSLSAVAKTLNNVKGSAVVGDELQARILAAASELGYSRHHQARAMSTGRAQAVGVLYTGSSEFLFGTFWGAIAAGVQSVVEAHDQHLVIVGSRDPAEMTERGVRMLREARIDAAILIGGIGTVPRLLQGRIVAVLPENKTTLSRVMVDHAPGIRAAVQHLKELGHERVLWFGMRYDDEERDPARRIAFLKAAKELGLATEVFLYQYSRTATDLSNVERYATGFSRYLDGHTPPTAVIAYNDFMAMGALDALKTKGLRVPSDVSVVGYDNLYGDVTVPALTSVNYNLFEVGAAAARLAFDLIDGQAGNITIPTTLAIHHSTGSHES